MTDSDFSFGGLKIPQGTKRLYVTATLVPGSNDPRIQPTGFPDIGPVFYPDPSGKHGQICLIESEASMANRLEEVCFADKYTGTLRPELAGLPYITVMKGDRFMTGSTVDGHRFASEYLLKAKFKEGDGDAKKDQLLVDYLKEKLGVDPSDSAGKSVPAANVARVFRLAMEFDPLSLIHGFQISSDKLSFVGLRSPRALTASIVGLNASPVGVPGVKFNPLATGKEAEGYQPIFRKERIVAETIEANFAVDLGLLGGMPVGTGPTEKESEEVEKKRHGVCEARRELLVSLSLWKIARFLKDLSEGHRLRTECDLAMSSAKYRVKWDATESPDFPYAQIVADGGKQTDGAPANGSLADLIKKAELPAKRDPLTLEFGA